MIAVHIFLFRTLAKAVAFDSDVFVLMLRCYFMKLIGTITCLHLPRLLQ